MTVARSASANFADASVNMLPRPLPELPPGWKYGERIGGWGPYSIVRDPDFSSRDLTKDFDKDFI